MSIRVKVMIIAVGACAAVNPATLAQAADCRAESVVVAGAATTKLVCKRGTSGQGPIIDGKPKSRTDTGITPPGKAALVTLSPLDKRWLECRTADPICLDAISTGTFASPSAPPAPGQPPQPALSYQLLQQAATQLDIGKPEPQVGPDPSLNEWGIVAVGYPIWLWVDGPSTMTQSVTEQGITINLVARRTSVVFDMGDGSQVTCTDMPRWPGPSNPPKPSPSCGYSYQRLPKTPGAGYTMSVTASWDVAWSALGQSGSLALSTTGDRNMPVGELQSVLVASGQR